MKKLILTAALGLAFVTGASAQGTLNFSSASAGAVFRTSNSLGALAAGATYEADLWYGAQGSAESALTELGLPSYFQTGAQAGFFTGTGPSITGGARTIPGFAGGTAITAQVRVWNATSGATYDTSSETGKSALFSITLTTAPATPVNLTGLNGQNIQLTNIPEPATVAMAGLGLAGLMIFRRRK
jgi:hypothetical protein